MADINTAISLINTHYPGTQYYAIFSGTNQIRVFDGCPPRPYTGSSTQSYTSYDYVYGIPLSQGTQSISASTFTLNSVACSSDSGPHGQITIDDSSLRVLAYIPFVPFYLFLSIFIFYFLIKFCLQLFFGRRFFP